MVKKKFKRVVVVSDLHCGHRAGLTPPDHWQKGTSYFQQQQKTWNFYTDALKELQKEHPIDYLICNGDAIDGKGQKSGGTELYEPDRSKQVEIAEICLREAKADKYMLVYGTAYHTGQDEDWEKQLAWRLDAEITGHLFWECPNTGITFDVKHKVGSSQVPWGRFTAINKDKIWNTIWHDKGGQPDGDIIIRSHVHYFAYSGDGSYLCVVTPALQGFGSKYGVRECVGMVNFGFIWFDIEENGSYDWGSRIMQYEVVKQKDDTFESRLK